MTSRVRTDVPTSAIALTKDVRDNFVIVKSELEDLQAFKDAATTDTSVWVEVGSGGSAPAFANSWTNYGSVYSHAKFKKKDGRVYLIGLIAGGTSGVEAFILPDGYRPSASDIYAVTSNGGFGFVQIDTNGKVNVWGSSTSLSLAGINFEAAT